MAPPPPSEDHDCGWKARAIGLEDDLAKMQDKIASFEEKMAAMERRFLGKKSEKIVPVAADVRKVRPKDPAETQATRRANAELRATKVETEDKHHPVPAASRKCPKCCSTKLSPLGEGKISYVLDYVPGYFRRTRHIREVLACKCAEHVVTAPGPEHSKEGTSYGDGLRAWVVTSKCADSIPVYRQAKQLSRLGIPMARSTLNDLLHQAADSLAPLSTRLLKLIAASDVVLADETSLLMQKPNKRGFVWAFLADKMIAYKFAGSRSGETPMAVLGGTTGTLVVDMYTGYNKVTGLGKRTRAACLAHARRKFFEAKEHGNADAIEAINLIRDVYVVEHDARERGICGTDGHGALRASRSRAIMDRLADWLRQKNDAYPPKSPMGRAISYAAKNWTELTEFLNDPKIPPDNNRSESALRVIALGRKNFLFVGDEANGEELAGLYSLVSTCEINGVDPLAYLTDVLGRTGSHPASKLDELLPHIWRPPA